MGKLEKIANSDNKERTTRAMAAVRGRDLRKKKIDVEAGVSEATANDDDVGDAERTLKNGELEFLGLLGLRGASNEDFPLLETRTKGIIVSEMRWSATRLKGFERKGAAVTTIKRKSV